MKVAGDLDEDFDAEDEKELCEAEKKPASDEKEKYFEFYDDVKDKSRKKHTWSD